MYKIELRDYKMFYSHVTKRISDYTCYKISLNIVPLQHDTIQIEDGLYFVVENRMFVAVDDVDVVLVGTFTPKPPKWKR